MQIKIKDDAISLPPEIIRTYLQGIKPYPIEPKPDPVHVPRKFLRLAYGGSDQQFLQFITPERNPSGSVKRRMVLPMLDMNPAMPRFPGQPGLLFASRHEVLEGPWTVFCRRLDSKEATWRYLGEYESELVGKMTAQQFNDQTSVVRNHNLCVTDFRLPCLKVKSRWGDLLISQRNFECYVSMRSRIALRKAGQLPSGCDARDAALIAEEQDNVKFNRGLPVDCDDIIEAFSRGDEVRRKISAAKHYSTDTTTI